MTDNITQEQAANMVALVQKLNGLGIKAKPSSLEQGPIVTVYLFDLDHSESISRILKRSEDFALSMGQDNIIVKRVKDKIGIFVPNKERQVVDFKDILHWYLHDEDVAKMQLPIPLGVDFHGNKSAIDLAECPHMLITGTTGSGKSVFETDIISSLVYFYDPSKLNFYLVDTKKVDLPLFKNVPHVKQVASTVDEFHQLMFWLMPEIRRRLGVFQNMSVQNIQQYHKMMGGIESMPFIILMMDEFGDLGELDKAYRKADKEKYETIPTVKQWIQQCVQIARAAGVHVIACTQRASVKVIDGDIKANLPCRISLRLLTLVDSRTVLDQGGAENLLGKGDMLVKRPDNDTVERFHGPFVKREDIQQLIMNYEYIKESMRR